MCVAAAPFASLGLTSKLFVAASRTAKRACRGRKREREGEKVSIIGRSVYLTSQASSLRGAFRDYLWVEVVVVEGSVGILKRRFVGVF